MGLPSPFNQETSPNQASQIHMLPFCAQEKAFHRHAKSLVTFFIFINL